MHHINFKLIQIFCFIGIFASGSSFAAESIEIVRSSGKVAIKQDDQKERTVGSKSILPTRHTLVTGPNGRAVVRVGEAGYIVVEKNSTIEIDRAKGHVNFFRQVTGMIYYAVKAIKGDQRKFEVRTSTATIGIRGTRFLVADMPDRNEIGMRKGLISVTSPDKDFEIHRKAEQDEFEAFKQEGKDAIAEENRNFEEYKAKSEREFVEYKREFTLEANRMVSFDGQRVDDRPLSGETQKDMETLEAYGKEWLDKVSD